MSDKNEVDIVSSTLQACATREKRGDLQTVQRSDVIEKGRVDPILYGCLNYWYKGLMTYEEAMNLAVISLISEKEILLEKHLAAERGTERQDEFSDVRRIIGMRILRRGSQD